MDFIIRNTCYTTVDRRATFTFDFVHLEQGNIWRVYIRAQASYRGRPDGAHASHRLSDERGTYICWDRPIRTLDEAKGVARAWADATHVYIETGRFPPPGPSRLVPDLSSSARWPHAALSGPIPGNARHVQPPAASRPSIPPARRAGAVLTPQHPTPESRRRTLGGWLNNIWRDA